ncbi:hypothetical protein [Ammoniphilus resinae]|uniref:Uncharacterized protein n=1 Tax=Ammoniphilus resinae TaxID=861532 RepID=A0ABS4GW90_9BACL|nr:hypothetical protein [Ammoniphilus resinae]MBP1934532.1 hypothetical protein [Ammoniphilus resinae]
MGIRNNCKCGCSCADLTADIQDNSGIEVILLSGLTIRGFFGGISDSGRVIRVDNPELGGLFVNICCNQIQGIRNFGAADGRA